LSLSLSFSFYKYRISRFGKPGKIVNIHRNSDGTIESLDVKYLSSGKIAPVLDPSLIKPYQHNLLKKSKAGNVQEKKTEAKQDTVKSSEKQEKTEETQETVKCSEKLETTKKQHTEKSLEKQDTIEKTEKKKEKKTEEKKETEATQEPAAKEDNAGLTRQALKFVERRHARRNLSPRSSRRRVRRITKPVAPPKTDVELETKPETENESKLEKTTWDAELAPTPVAPPNNDEELKTKPEAELDSKPEEATLDAELTPTRPSRPPRLTSTPDCMKLYEADKHAALSVPASTPEFVKNFDAVSVPVPSAEFLKSYAAEKDAAISVPADAAAGSTLVTVQATSSPEIRFQATALLPETREVVMGEHHTRGINSDSFLDLVSESKDLLNGTNTQNDKNRPADEYLLNSAAKDEIPMNRSAEEPFLSTPRRSMERKVDTSWTESPCPISTPKRLLYQDEVSLAKTPPRVITPLPTRRVNGQVMYTTESPSVEIRARVAPRPVSTPPRSKEVSLETSSAVSTPRKNNTSSQDATLETLEDTDQSGEMEHNSSLETTLSEENTAEENEETKLSATVKMGKTASYLHNLLVGDSYSLDTASDSLDTASVEETDLSNSYDCKTLSATPAPTEANTAKDIEETNTAAKPKPGTVNYLHTLLVGDSYSLGTASIEEMDRSHSYDYHTDQSATDDDMDERSTCSEELPRSKKMEPDIRFDFCASDTIADDFRMVAKLLAQSSTLFTGECPPECRVPRKRVFKRGARKADKVTFADIGGDNKTPPSTATAAATEGLIDISRLQLRPQSNGSNKADQHRDCRFAC
jgi:hypothetical protein